MILGTSLRLRGHVLALLLAMGASFCVLELFSFAFTAYFNHLMLSGENRIIDHYNYRHRTVLKCIPGFLNNRNFGGRCWGNVLHENLPFSQLHYSL